MFWVPVQATVLLPMRTKEDLTTDELHQLKVSVWPLRVVGNGNFGVASHLQQRCQQLPLPPGLYFTGHYYSSLDGEKSTEHPCILFPPCV